MKLLGKNKRSHWELPSFVTFGLIRFNLRLLAVANWLQVKSNHYSLRKKKFLLALFVIVFVTGSVIITLNGIAGNCNNAIAVTRIKHTVPQKEVILPALVGKEEFLKIQGFKNYIDSLNSTSKGRKVKDSLLMYRPRLMNSVKFLINLYLEQSKTKRK